MNQPVRAKRQGWIDPADLFEDYAGRSHCVWLDTAGETGGLSILAADPCRVLSCKGSAITLVTPDGSRTEQGNPFDVLRRELDRFKEIPCDWPDRRLPPGAAIGYLGYDLKNHIERLPANALDDLQVPDLWFAFYRNLLVFDHEQQVTWEVTGDDGHGSVPVVADPAAATVGPVVGASLTPSGLVANFSHDGYLAAVNRAKDYIAAGDIYQVNLAQRFQANVEESAAAVYRVLRRTNPAPYCAYLDTGPVQVLSSSPECFLSLADRRVLTRPIKGTRRRGDNDVEDLAQARELQEAGKDNAELLMITDLERNDLGRVCAYGSVRVPDLVRLEKYATVLHLVSTVTGDLRPEIRYVDCVKACFPGGSISGAPKIRAMEIIDELEPHTRGVYTGSIGYFGFGERTAQFNIAIRTITRRETQLTFHAGAGIVADSVPEAEYEETLAKAEGITNAIDELRLCQRAVPC